MLEVIAVGLARKGTAQDIVTNIIENLVGNAQMEAVIP